ncbi:hypothetical protein [Actinomadura macra]|uniref:hypothetical protein n=1 Tax=Actinomadura macra TaxID=46164 RepID=UPI00082BE80F|nr:hypothetical protein [Actinomadura macra]
MKKVMTGVMIVAAVAMGGAGSVAAAQSPPEQGARQDCRTYSSTTECGKVQLNDKQRACVTSAVQLGMTERRAEVECVTFD